MKMSFDEVRDSLVISFAEGSIILYEDYESVNPFICIENLSHFV